MKVSILGVEFYSDNKGCGALAYSSCILLQKIAQDLNEELEITAFVNIPDPLPVLPVSGVSLQCIKYQIKSLDFWKKARKIFRESNFIIDFSLGDSFSDLYGTSRFYKHSLLRECALMSGRPYVLGPQTFGPFDRFWSCKWAKHILKKSKLCFARDVISKEYVQKLCGKEAVVTTDVAFALCYTKASLEEKEEVIKIGFNPSGLLWDDQKLLANGRHIQVDYKEYVEELMEDLCGNPKYQVYLIPHVFSKADTPSDNDWVACKEIHDKFPQTILAPRFADPMEAKGFISALDIFIGARMHATIAAMSSGVVTIPFSYSRKFEGLFQNIQYQYVISATKVDTSEALKLTKSWIHDRENLQKAVQDAQTNIEEKKEKFIKEMERFIKG